jgi:hypothetical protein
MSQEREFMEGLLNQRFDFFLVLFAATIGGAASVWSNDSARFLILLIGLVVECLLSQVLARAQEKLNLILQELEKDPAHPFKIIDDKANRTGSKRNLVGYCIPRLCCTVLLLSIAFSVLESIANTNP